CACGNPLFWNSIMEITYTIEPKRCRRSLSKCARRLRKARQTSTGISATVCPGKSLETISGHFGLVVIVRKMEGLPYWRQTAKASATFSEAHAREPMKLLGRVVERERCSSLS